MYLSRESGKRTIPEGPGGWVGAKFMRKGLTLEGVSYRVAVMVIVVAGWLGGGPSSRKAFLRMTDGYLWRLLYDCIIWTESY